MAVRNNSTSEALIQLLPLVLGLFLATAGLYVWQERVSGRAFEDLALGPETTSIFASIQGLPVHCSTLRNTEPCLRRYKDMGDGRPVVLWLGNSQLHAINQFSEGEETAIPLLFESLYSNGKYLITLSQPNANLQEHYSLLAYMLTQVPIDVLILPLVFDDMRETGVRAELQGIFGEPTALQHLGTTPFGRELIRTHQQVRTPDSDLAGLDETVQQLFENRLSERFGKLIPLWEHRAALRGSLFEQLYKLRNRIFGINASSVRKVIPGPYKLNRDALTSILSLAEENEIGVLLYIAPLRSDVPVPYDQGQYSDFKQEMAELAEQKGVRLLNLESLVPGSLWGSKSSTVVGKDVELDFMHFQAGGHRLLAEQLYAELRFMQSKPLVVQ